MGCGWRPAASKVQELSVLDYMTEQEAYGKCERCFKRHGFPADWALEPAEVPTLQEDSDSSADSGSETDDSVDTQSETEVVALPLLATKGMGGPERGHGQGPQHRLASFRNGGCARLSFGNGAIGLHTRSSVFENCELGGP